MENQKTLKESAQAYESHSGRECIECGKRLEDYRSKRCRSCWLLFTEKGYAIIPNKGEENINWKGDKAGYRSLHSWIRRNKPKVKRCEKCEKKTKLQVSNISGKYLRDINDYEWLCPKCHIYKDGTIKNLEQRNKFKLIKFKIGGKS